MATKSALGESPIFWTSTRRISISVLALGVAALGSGCAGSKVNQPVQPVIEGPAHGLSVRHVPATYADGLTLGREVDSGVSVPTGVSRNLGHLLFFIPQGGPPCTGQNIEYGAANPQGYVPGSQGECLPAGTGLLAQLASGGKGKSAYVVAVTRGNFPVAADAGMERIVSFDYGGLSLIVVTGADVVTLQTPSSSGAGRTKLVVQPSPNA